MNKKRERLLHELTKEPEEKKVSIQDFAKRLLIGFFVMMILLTVISRAADSVTIAKIKVASAKQGKLNFEVEGVGTLEEKAEKYLDIYAGVRIEEITVKEGQNIEKDDVLFYYDINDLEDILKGFEDELTKIELTIQKEKLNYEVGKAGTEKEAAELLLERAKIDLLTAKEDLKLAKKAIGKEKKEALEKEEQNYKEALEKEDQNYYDANEKVTEQEEKKDKAIEKLKKGISQAKENLDELYEEKAKVEAKVEATLLTLKTAIISNNSEYIQTAEINMLKEYYGEKEYENHEKLIADAQKVLLRAREDYRNAMIAEIEEGRFLSTSEKVTYNRAIQDAEEKLVELKAKDKEILDASTEYRNAIQNNNFTNINNTYSILFDLLYTYTEDDSKKELIKDANKTIAKAKEELEEATKEWEKTLEKEEEAVANTLEKEEEVVANTLEILNKVQAVYSQVLDDTYDYSTEVKLELRQIEVAKRAIEDARNSLKEVKKNDKEILIKDNKNKQIEELNLKSYEIDIKEKKEKIAKVKNIINNEGKVTAPVKGVLTKLGIEVKSITSGTEKVTIALNNYEFEAKVTKDEANRLTVGDEMSIMIGNSKDKLIVPIENISLENVNLEDEEGKYIITGIMPIGEYSVGAAVSFKVSKQSETYRQTVPIQALRTDSKGKTYVLITKEMNTMLGNELTAFPIYVTVLEKDYLTAAIEGILDSKDELIISSNKNIEEGDRVRVSESNDEED